MRITIDIEPSPRKSTLLQDLAPLASMLLGYIIGTPSSRAPMPDFGFPDLDDCKPRGPNDCTCFADIGARMGIRAPHAEHCPKRGQKNPADDVAPNPPTSGAV